MRNRDGSLWIVYNGEIYNYLEIRADLISMGYEFRTETDTEVILNAYQEWGLDCLNKFNGMWAFAILDRSSNKVFCSRDRFGVKPFYYAETRDAWVFGSEIRQLLPFLPNISANLKVVEEFLFAGITEPREETFFEGVHKLPGGHNLTYDLSTNSYTIQRFYELTTNPDLGNMGMDEAIQIYGDRLSAAVSLRLRADVAVGTCLSGGLDSSSVATLAAEPYRNAVGDSFRAITAVSELQANDESAFAQQVATHSGMKWLAVKPTYDDFAQNLHEVVRAQEEPFGSPSICIQFFVMKTARKNGIPVLLDGQGGDETLLGYERYYIGHFLNLLKRIGIKHAIKSLIDCWQNNSKMSPIRILQFLVYFSSARLRYWNYCYRNRYLRKRPYLPEAMQMNAEAIWDIQKLQKLEIEKSNLPHLLRFEDKNSMWHSVEARLPFLDYRAVQTAFSLPSETKINRGWTKYVLRRFMNGKMPVEITWRKNKFGFEAPDRIWLTRHATIMHKTVASSKLLEALSKPGFIERLYPRLDIGTRWRLFSVALWEKEFAVEA
jgi:asparagine synthase (glutamine-hydrolysing)